ncbi:hypothetical protein Q7L65_27435 [Conexibacter sp. CPCC 206217]|nr:hypothetical protein [Conexibacter sp. CPCC 206217]
MHQHSSNKESNMASLIKSAFTRLFENSTRPEPVHFHSGVEGTVVCHDEACASPRLDLRDARELQSSTADLR